MIIVFTLGRSGSSLLMQTLRELGVSIAGRGFDVHDDPVLAAEHHRLNPGGYFEEPDLYYRGTATPAFEDFANGPDVACKMDLRHLTDPRQLANWQRVAGRITAAFVSFREPSEQAHSEFIATHTECDRTEQVEFPFKTSFLKRYRRVLEQAETVLSSGLNELESHTHWVDYRLTRSPSEYVATISNAVGLQPDAPNCHRAESLVDGALYRVRRARLSDAELNWAEALGATATYQRLSEPRLPLLNR